MLFFQNVGNRFKKTNKKIGFLIKNSRKFKVVKSRQIITRLAADSKSFGKLTPVIREDIKTRQFLRIRQLWIMPHRLSQAYKHKIQLYSHSVQTISLFGLGISLFILFSRFIFITPFRLRPCYIRLAMEEPLLLFLQNTKKYPIFIAEFIGHEIDHPLYAHCDRITKSFGK